MAARSDGSMALPIQRDGGDAIQCVDVRGIAQEHARDTHGRRRDAGVRIRRWRQAPARAPGYPRSPRARGTQRLARPQGWIDP